MVLENESSMVKSVSWPPPPPRRVFKRVVLDYNPYHSQGVKKNLHGFPHGKHIWMMLVGIVGVCFGTALEGRSGGMGGGARDNP